MRCLGCASTRHCSGSSGFRSAGSREQEGARAGFMHLCYLISLHSLRATLRMWPDLMEFLSNRLGDVRHIVPQSKCAGLWHHPMVQHRDISANCTSHTGGACCRCSATWTVRRRQPTAGSCPPPQPTTALVAASRRACWRARSSHATACGGWRRWRGCFRLRARNRPRGEGAGGHCSGVQRCLIWRIVFLNAGVALRASEAANECGEGSRDVVLTKSSNVKQVLRTSAITSNWAHDLGTQMLERGSQQAQSQPWRPAAEGRGGFSLATSWGLPRCAWQSSSKAASGDLQLLSPCSFSVED